ncbi:DUF1549 and DUF1553 domain-containing protein [Thermogutta sp.]|uniref:DUF1549 and DUF1553 domain-containing protein n=1 Tax=Thermogutta sp. TaxID=1962930 RepID=UPI00321F89C9
MRSSSLIGLLAVVLTVTTVLAGVSAQPIEPFDSDQEFSVRNRIDELMVAKWKEQGITPAFICSDAVFLRRVYLDLIGTLPTEDEAKKFLEDSDPQKREKLIDELLNRPEYADYWTMRWGDVLRIKAEFPINLWPNAVQAYNRWLYSSLARNKPYDQFVRELLTSSGSNFRVGPVNFYRATQDRSPKGIAQAVALTFMGVRADQWPEEKLKGMAAFFSQISFKSTMEWKEEIVSWDPYHANTATQPPPPQEAVFPDGVKIQLPADRDPRQVFADWLISPKNPWFAKNVVNRIWYWLFGRGIIHEPDDIRDDNPAVAPEVLSYLESELVRSGWDLKHIYRLICNSGTYQLSCIARSRNPKAGMYFAYYPTRRLDAEVLIDAICQITGTSEEYWSMVPEPYTIISQGERAVRLGDASITSAFLELFGRPPRDVGLISERANRMTASQRLHLLNSSHILTKIEQGPGLEWARNSYTNPRQTVTRLYLTILSRYPTEKEWEILKQTTAKSSRLSREMVIDLIWALMNSTEFLYRH